MSSLNCANEEILIANGAKLLSNYSGREKSNFICENKLIVLQDQLKDSEQKRQAVSEAKMKAFTAMYNAGKMQEKDWAIHGGIANGIAGPVAGLATALEIQQQNAQAREHNQQLIKTLAQIQAGSILHYNDFSIGEIEEEINELYQEIENNKKKKVRNVEPVGIFTEMKPKLIKQERTKSGAIKLTVQIHPIPNLIISENIKAAIDGGFKALLLHDNKIVGEAYFNLPYNGLTSSTTIIGYCVDCQTVADNYEIVLIPLNLWMVETSETISLKRDVDCCTDDEKNMIIYYFVLDALNCKVMSVNKYKNLLSVLDKANVSKSDENFIKLKNRIIDSMENQSSREAYEKEFPIVKEKDIVENEVKDLKKQMEQAKEKLKLRPVEKKALSMSIGFFALGLIMIVGGIFSLLLIIPVGVLLDLIFGVAIAGLCSSKKKIKLEISSLNQRLNDQLKILNEIDELPSYEEWLNTK